jgi:hypothetical protein
MTEFGDDLSKPAACACLNERCPVDECGEDKGDVMFFLDNGCKSDDEKDGPGLFARAACACLIPHPSSVVERRTTDDGRRTTDDGRRTTDDGRRTTDDGRRTTGDGRRTTGDGRRTTDNGRRLTDFIVLSKG